MSTPNTLFLLDAMALIYRAYFAFNNQSIVNSKGINTAPIMGFVNTLLEVIDKQKPTHLVVAFDSYAPTLREGTFAEYKANRQATPDDIIVAIPYIKKIIQAFNIPLIELAGYEADDIIGTLAKQAEAEGLITYMMTPDKDYGQLVSATTFIYKPAKMGNPAVVMGEPEILEKYGITNPFQLIDILALWGDSVDNIPGVSGVGEKTAMALIKEYGGIENIFANAGNIKGKLGEKLQDPIQQQKARMSYELATIILDVPIEFHVKQSIIVPINREAVREIFTELEFRKLTEKVLGEKLQGSKQEEGFSLFNQPDIVLTSTETDTAYDTPTFTAFTKFDASKVTYTCVDTMEGIQALVQILLQQKEIGIDTETTSLDPIVAELVGIAFAYTPYEAFYIPCDSTNTKEIIEIIQPIFDQKEITLIGQNLKYDLRIFATYSVYPINNLWDTMLAHYLLHPENRHNLDYLAETFLQYETITTESLIGKKGKNQLSMRDISVDRITNYACEDIDITLRLKAIFAPMLAEQGLEHLFHTIEMPLVKVLATMEQNGISIDTEYLQVYDIKISEKISILETTIYELAGVTFNLNSPKQLSDILFKVLGIASTPSQKGKTSQLSTAEDVLAKLVDKHLIISPILEYRTLQKLRSTYIKAIPEMVSPITNRLHTQFQQTVAATGRLSSTSPNVQNIPIRTEEGREIRKSFVSRETNYNLLAADYSQIELRIMAAVSKEENMIKAFQDGIDIHTTTAANVFGVTLEEVDADMRRKAKMVNFGIIYGISAFGLSERLQIPRREAATLIENYFATYPAIKTYMDMTIEQCKQNGYVETLSGRRRYLRDINAKNATIRAMAERMAINTPIQGTAADMIKIAMVKIAEILQDRDFKSKLLLQVHDELVIELYTPEKETLIPLLTHSMQHTIPLAVPIEINIGIGKNWLEAH